MPASEMAKCVFGSFLFVVVLLSLLFLPLPLTVSKKIIQNHTHTTKKHSLLRDNTTHFIRRETMSNDGSTNASLFFVAGSCVGMLVRRSFFFILFKLNHNENNKFVRSRSLVVCYYCFY